MLGMVGVLTAAICTSCVDEQNPTGLRLGVPQPTVELKLSDGCARFQVRFDAGGAPIIEPIFNTGYCALNDLKLLSDTAGSFDPATGTLRVAVVMENIGTTAVIPDVRLFFNADSVKRFNAQGEPVPGTPDILAYQPDSADGSGRRARWFWDAWLAPSGQPQVLQPGGRTERRWVEFRGTGWTERVRLKLFAWGAKQAAVPATAPDSLPTALMASLPLLTDETGQQHRSELVVLSFRSGTPQPVRQAVIGGVGGVVVGGKAGLQKEGWYIVRVSTANTMPAIHSVVMTLRADPSVELVGPFTLGFPDDESWRRPDDGANWDATDWQVDPLRGVGANSALERISLPMAWGCSTGSAATRLTLVDRGFQLPTDLAPSVAQPITDPGPLRDHATRVASIVSAAGSNNSGITGVMWQSTLYLRNPGADPANPAQLSSAPWYTALLDNLVEAGRNGSSVILLPRNYPWPGLSPETSSVAGRAIYEQEVLQRDSVLTSAVRILRSEGRFPLFVISAGNHGWDARWGGFVNVNTVYPNQVLVVGALTHSISSAGQANIVDLRSNGGPAVDVYAPGDNIAMLDSTGAVLLDGGTSFAVPLVAGVAGLVKSFLPTLPDTLLKEIVLGGTSDSVSTSAGMRPVLNAYLALRKAATRPGAPLCGNRVWAAGKDVVVQRNNGPETIAVLADSQANPNRVFPLHGGRLLYVPTVGGELYDWTPNGFVKTSRFPTADELPFKGTMESHKPTHDGDSTSLDIVTGSSAQVMVSALNGGFPTGTPVPVGNPITFPADVHQLERRCWRYDYNVPTQAYVCADSMDTHILQERTTVTTIPSPGLGHIAVAVTRLRTQFVSETMQDCQNASATPPSKCPRFTFEETPLHTRLMVLRRSDGATLSDVTVNGVHLRLNTFTEDDTELAVEERSYVSQSTDEMVGVIGGNGWMIQGSIYPEVVTGCALVYYDRPATSAPVPTRMSVSPAVCANSNGVAAFGRQAVGPVVRYR